CDKCSIIKQQLSGVSPSPSHYNLNPTPSQYHPSHVCTTGQVFPLYSIRFMVNFR
ncbi:hypothetical protein J6590_085397, partial [Homalodisca vitripennis]